ncbi:MAG: S-layer homology domain-containing protein [Caldisericia bacterium]|nr:S-layer homology domain-containing protein [Caldisericia bacterium]
MNTRKIKETLKYQVFHHSCIPVHYSDELHLSILKREAQAFNEKNPSCDSVAQYNYVILPSGRVENLVPAGIYTAHCGLNTGEGKINNDNSISICVSANLDREKMTDLQWKALINEARYQGEHRGLKPARHKDIVATSCPGRNFPYSKLLKEMKVKKLYDDVDEKRWSYPAIEYVSRAGIMTGDEYGFRPKDPVTREELAQVIYNLERKK